MKLYLKRDKSWISDVISMECTIEELTVVQLALENYKKWMEDRAWHLDNEKDFSNQSYIKVRKALEDLGMKNALDSETLKKIFTKE